MKRTLALALLAGSLAGGVVASQGASAASPRDTIMQAVPAQLVPAPNAKTRDTLMLQLQASLRSHTQWLPDRVVVFKTETGGWLCAARTDARGVATCNVMRVRAVLSHSYMAFFGGDASYDANSAQATITTA